MAKVKAKAKAKVAAKPTAKSQRRIPDHIFRFKTRNGTMWKWRAKATYATKPVDLIITAEDVRKSIELEGAGNPEICPMALCVQRQNKQFPHPVAGYVDWTWTRAYVASKVNQDLQPVGCVIYKHKDDIARYIDTPGGLVKLLKILEKEGPRIVRLAILQKRPPQPKGRPEGRYTGERTPKPRTTGTGLRGAKLRIAVANGGIPPPDKTRLPRKAKQPSTQGALGL